MREFSQPFFIHRYAFATQRKEFYFTSVFFPQMDYFAYYVLNRPVPYMVTCDPENVKTKPAMARTSPLDMYVNYSIGIVK
jgi:hypothetical protein